MSTRILRAALAASLLLVLGTAVTAAGGWATIVADDPEPPEPRAGEDVEYGFTVLQHGVTPADFEDPTLRLTNTITGETVDIPAAPSGEPGHFVARFEAPAAGSWSWGVVLTDLLVETQPVTAVVLETDGSRPVVDVGETLAAIDRAKLEVTGSIRGELLPRIDLLERDLGNLRETAAGLRGQVTGLERDRDELTAQLAAAQSALGSAGPSETIPPLGVALLAILGGACAGFAMAWLGMRRDPVAIEPATHVAGRPAPTA